MITEKIKADYKANRNNLKGLFVIMAFRLAHYVRCNGKLLYIIGLPYLVLYRVTVEWAMGIEIPPLTEIGKGCQIHHGQGLVINNKSIIGDHCILRHGVTIGNKGSSDVDSCPTIGSNVEIGAGAVIIGGISICDRCVIGANTVITRNLEPGAVVVCAQNRVLNNGNSTSKGDTFV